MTTEETVVVEAPAIVETTAQTQTDNTATAETTSTETVVETTETAPDPWFKKYEWESEDSATSEIETLRSLRGKQDELTAKEKEIENIQNRLDNPIPEEFQSIIAISKQTGIKDLSVLSHAMTVNAENAKSDPIAVIALQMQIQNPAKFNALGGKSGVEEALREKYNLPSEGEYTPSKLLVGEAVDALTEIEKITKNIQVDEKPFTFAKERMLIEQQDFEKRQLQSVGELEKFTSKLENVEYKYADKSLPLKVTKDEISAIMESSKPIAHLIDTSTPEGVASLKQWATDQVLLKKLKSGELGTEIEKSVRAESLKEATKEVHNGQAKTVDKTGTTTTVSTELSAIAKAAIRDGLNPNPTNSST